MLAFLGDIHGDTRALEIAAEHFGPDDTVIQVGDFGVGGDFVRRVLALQLPYRLLFVDGNHENHDVLWAWRRDCVADPTIRCYDAGRSETRLEYVPRGTVMELEGQLLAFLGGACSVDRTYRRAGINWWQAEQVTLGDLEQLTANLAGRSPDVLVTHTPPDYVTRQVLPPLRRQDWDLPANWMDVSSAMVAKAVTDHRPRLVVSGHLHVSRTVYAGPTTHRVLDINELWTPNP